MPHPKYVWVYWYGGAFCPEWNSHHALHHAVEVTIQYTV